MAQIDERKVSAQRCGGDVRDPALEAEVQRWKRLASEISKNSRRERPVGRYTVASLRPVQSRHPSPNQIGCELWQSSESILSPAVHARDVLSFDEARTLQAPMECA